MLWSDTSGNMFSQQIIDKRLEYCAVRYDHNGYGYWSRWLLNNESLRAPTCQYMDEQNSTEPLTRIAEHGALLLIIELVK